VPDPITIYSLSDEAVDNAGGRLFRIFGDFANQFGYVYNVHFGPTGTVADSRGFTGKPGKRHDIIYWNDIELRCYLPRLDVGVINVLIRRTDGGREQLIPNALQVYPQQYYSSVFDLRAILPPYYLLGPRNLENVEPT
jgi:hypothetical protein